jgi:hypothetical protein
LALGTLDHERPLLVEYCHCTVGVGVPDAAALNEAVDPAATVTLTGWLVTAGLEWLLAA